MGNQKMNACTNTAQAAVVYVMLRSAIAAHTDTQAGSNTAAKSAPHAPRGETPLPRYAVQPLKALWLRAIGPAQRD